MKIPPSRVAVKTVLMALTLAACSMGANAVVIYDEAADGDAASSAGSALIGADVGTLGPGENEILGSRDTGDFDDYIFEVPLDGLLLGITFSWDVVDGNFWGADLYTAGGTLLASFAPGVLGAGAPVEAFGSAVPLAPGTYRIDHNNAPFGVVNYTWALQVQAVPEPATLTLFVLGLAGLGAAARRPG